MESGRRRNAVPAGLCSMALSIAGAAGAVERAPDGSLLAIDTFATAQSAVTLSSAPGSVGAFQDGGGILQTERNIRVSGSSVAGGSISGSVSSGALTFFRPAGSTGQMDVWWDGDNSSLDFAPTGLGGIDLTDGGARNGLRVTVLSSTSATLVARLVVWTDGGSLSQASFLLPTAGGSVYAMFASFVQAGALRPTSPTSARST